MPGAVLVVFSNHRVEALARAEELMRRCSAVFLEEPPQPGFGDVLAGTMDLEAYLMETDYGFPEFARRSVLLSKRLHSEGVRFFQVEPYMEVLESIHERFAAGQTPEDMPAGGIERAIYRMERVWTAALVEFYRVSVSEAFEEAVMAVQRFARVDASRGRMRDSLRAQELSRLLTEGQAYVEAGYIHFALLHEMVRLLPASRRPRPVYLLEEAARRLTGRAQMLGPGDRLTLRYTFRPEFSGRSADLLAARSLIHVKVLEKEELLPGPEPYPHARDEAWAGELVRCLSFDNCRKLHERIRRLPTREARLETERFVRKFDLSSSLR
jgi:hypothetical protein